LIRIIVLGAVCMAGVGAIGAAATNRKSPEPVDVVFPVAAGNKADRLLVGSSAETLSEADKKVSPDLPPSQAELTSSPSPQPASLNKMISASSPDIVPRHWHEPQAPGPRSVKTKSSNLKQAKKSAAGTQETRDCRSDGLHPILRKLNLAPDCNS
jgi:hypothetical protein